MKNTGQLFVIHSFSISSKTIRWLAVFPLVIATFVNIIPLFIGENSVSSETYKWLSFISFLFVGLTGVVFFSCVTKFSSTWFSDGERATSTGLAFVMANLGNFGKYSNQVSILSGPSHTIILPD